MDKNEFGKLRGWLGEYKTKGQAQYEAGEIPVVGWLQLAATLETKKAFKRNLEAELDQNAREREQVAQQIKHLQQKQQQLENENQHLKEQMKQMDEITALEEESQSIDMLGKIEEAALAKLEKKMENAYFMEDLDAEDVSTVLTWTLCSPDSKRRIFTTTSRSPRLPWSNIFKSSWTWNSQKLWNFSGN